MVVTQLWLLWEEGDRNAPLYSRSGGFKERRRSYDICRVLSIIQHRLSMNLEAEANTAMRGRFEIAKQLWTKSNGLMGKGYLHASRRLPKALRMEFLFSNPSFYSTRRAERNRRGMWGRARWGLKVMEKATYVSELRHTVSQCPCQS